MNPSQPNAPQINPEIWKFEYGHSAIIQGDKKLIKFWISGHKELCNLGNDFGERHYLAQENPDKANKLYEILTGYLQMANPDLLRELIGQAR